MNLFSFMSYIYLLSSSSDGLTRGSVVALAGFLVVLFILALLVVFITLMSGTLSLFEKKESKTEVMPSKELLQSTPEEKPGDGPTIAVIAAAIAAFESGGKLPEAPSPGFKIKKIRRLY